MFVLAMILGGGLSALGDAQEIEPDLFQRSVTVAIQKGSDFLYRSPPGPVENVRLPQGYYPQGIRALIVYALLEAGASPHAPVVTRLIREIRELPPRRIYSVSLTILALDALTRRLEAAPPSEPERDRAPDRGIEKDLVRLVGWIVRARLPRSGLWGYEPRGRTPGDPARIWLDLSNTQFAVLALQAAIRTGLEVDPKVLQELAVALLESSQPLSRQRARTVIAGAGWWMDSKRAPRSGPGRSVQFTAEGSVLEGVPRGWSYRPPNARSFEAGRTSYSMTAAAVSSLIVAREGLARAGRLTAEYEREVDAAIGGGLIALARDLDTLHPSPSDSLLRNYYYTLYSFEKAMDLGGIEQLDGVDWYRGQARVLFGQQRDDGAWGHDDATVDPRFDQVSTAFALLFLARATRALRIEPPDPIVTRKTGRAPSERGLGGRIFLSSRGGMVELAELFGLLADLRTPELLEVAREAVRTVAPDRLPEILPYLAPLREGVDAVAIFAREQIRLISGLSADATADQIDAWLARWNELRSTKESRGSETTSQIGEVIRDEAATAPLRIAAIEAAIRVGSLDSVPDLIQALTAVDSQVRERAQRGLSLLTLRTPPAIATEGPPQEIAARWREFWELRGDEIRFRRRFGRLRDALDTAEDPVERARLRAEIIGLGPIALPEVESILKRDDYAFDWVLIKEGITGEKTGF